MAAKKPRIQQFYVFFSSLIVFIIHLLFVFAKAKTANAGNNIDVKARSSMNADSVLGINKAKLVNRVNSLYDSLKLNVLGLSRQAFDYALKGFDHLVAAGKITNDRVLSIADFSQPSSNKRLFVIDLQNYKLLFNTYVAHGSNSGTAFATKLSNTPESLQSSPGFYQTLSTYNGKHGYSLKLEGLERGINDKAYERAIVMHAADYVNEGLAKSRGYIGRSWGCPALPPQLNKPIIDKIKNGSCLFIYSPDNRYLNSSRIMQAAANAQPVS